MAFLYQPPQAPYRGLETGLASNVYCENVNTLFNAVNTPVATTGANVPASPATGIQLLTANGIFGWDIANSIMESRTSVPVINTAATGETLGTGTGMTVKLRYHPDGTTTGTKLPVVDTDVGYIAVVIDNPGTGYKAGDRVSVTSANAQLIFAAGTFVQNLQNQTTTKLEAAVNGKKPMAVVIPGGSTLCGITFTLSTTVTPATSYDELVCSAQGNDGGVQMQLSGADNNSSQFSSNNALPSASNTTVIAGATIVTGSAATSPAAAVGPWDLGAPNTEVSIAGSGFTCSITWAAATATSLVAIITITGGTGYLPGDVITYNAGSIRDTIRTLSNANAAPFDITNNLVITLTENNFTSFFDWIPTGQDSDSSFVMQIVKVHFPKPSISSDDYAKIDDTYTCTSNVTSSRSHLAITSIAGFVTNALDADTGSDGTEDGSSGGKLIVSLIRYAPPGFSLAPGILNCRIGKRQNPVIG